MEANRFNVMLFKRSGDYFYAFSVRITRRAVAEEMAMRWEYFMGLPARVIAWRED